MIDSYYQYKQNADKENNKGVAGSKNAEREVLDGVEIPEYCLNADFDDDEGESNMAALGCLDVIQKILNCNLKGEVYIHVYPKV